MTASIQMVDVERTAVGEFSFGQQPNAFIGIKLGGVGRKVLHVQARVATEEIREMVPRGAWRNCPAER